MIGRVVLDILLQHRQINVRVFQINIIDFKSNLFLSEIVVKREIFEESELKFDGPEKLGKPFQ